MNTKLDEFKNASALALEASPEVKNFIYCYFDTQLKKYHPPFINEIDPSHMVDGLKMAVIKGQADPKQMTAQCLCFVGIFELNEGKLECFDKPEVIANMDDLFARFGGSNDVKVA